MAVLQTLEDVHLPERAGPVERAAEHVGRELDQLGGAARRGERDPAHVILDVEVGVLDPERMVQLERHLHETAPEESRTAASR